jgi:Homeodomain-like domain
MSGQRSGDYRSRGRWRGGRPRVSREVRELIVQMARENFTWGAPRIHGELLMLGSDVSQATVSRYLSTVYRRPGQSWRTFGAHRKEASIVRPRLRTVVLSVP